MVVAKRWLLTISLLAIVLLLPSQSVQAESTDGIVVSPPFQQVTIADAPSTAFSVVLTNRTSQPQTISVSSIDFKSLDESGGVAFLGSEITTLERKYGLAKWLTLETGSLTIPAFSSKKIGMSIENRPDLAPGGHYAAAVFKVETGGTSQASNSVAIKQVVASLIFAKKIGGEHYDLKLVNAETPKNWGGKNQNVMLRFYNPGNVHVVPRGIVSLVDANGRVLSRGIINQESGIVLPESHRIYPTVLTHVPTLKPGKYKLVVKYRYDGISNFAVYTKQISIFDWRFAAILGAIGFVCLLVVAIGLTLGFRRKPRRAKKPPPKSHASF